MTLFFRTRVGVGTAVLLNENSPNVSSAISLDTPARCLIIVEMSCQIYEDERDLPHDLRLP
jgi:hypothetical protein